MDNYQNEFTKLFISLKDSNLKYFFLTNNDNYLSEKYNNDWVSFSQAIKAFGSKLKPHYILYGLLIKNPNYNFNDKGREKALEYINFTNNNNTFDTIITDFLISMRESHKIYENIGMKIMEIENFIYKFPDVNYSVKYGEYSKNFSIKYNNKVIDPTIISKIFHMIKLDSDIISAIFTNIKGNKYYKVNNKYTNINKDITFKTYEANTIVVMFKNKKNPIIIDFNTGKLYIDIISNKDDFVNLILIKKLHFLQFDEIDKKDGVSGTLTYNTSLKVDFYEYIMTNPLISYFFSVNETTNLYCVKDMYNVSFKDHSKRILIAEENPNLLDNLNFKNFKITIKVPKNNSQLKSMFEVFFTVENDSVLNKFATKFGKLISYMNTFSTDKSKEIFTKDKSIVGTIYNRPSLELKAKAPELFDNKILEIKGEEKRYLNSCQGKVPTIIEKDEIESWEKYGKEVGDFPPIRIEDAEREEHIKSGGNIKTFTPTQKTYYMVCPLSNHPHLYISKVNLPCCGQTPLYRQSEGYLKYGKDIVNERKKSTNKIATDKMLMYCQQSKINDYLESFFKDIFNYNDSKVFFKKMGFIFSNDNLINAPNDTFIRSVLYSKGEINKDTNFEEIRNKTRRVRVNMSNLPLNVYKQELYDWSDEKIRSTLLDDNEYIDPYLFYRGVEIVLEVQLFIFYVPDNLKNASLTKTISYEQEKSDFPVLEIPRCKHFHSRIYNNNPVVCLFKNFDSDRQRKTNSKKNRPIELIFSTINTDNLIYLFRDKQFLDGISNYLEKSNLPYEWDLNSTETILDCYRSPYSFNWENFNFGHIGNIIGQELDGYGKARYLIFKEWTIRIPPSQPLFIHNERKIERPPLKTLCELYNVFDSSNATIEDGEGVYLPFNGKRKGLLILCKTNSEQSIISNEEIPLKNKISNIIKNKNKASLLMQIINWLWRSDVIIINDDKFEFPNFKEWFENKVIILDDDYFENSPLGGLYNNEPFPEGNTYDERIDNISLIWPFFFRHGKIYLNDLLNTKIMNFFRREEIITRGINFKDRKVSAPKYVTNLNILPEDNDRDNDIIFNDTNSIKNWLSHHNGVFYEKNSLSSMKIIHNFIQPQFSELTEPYLFVDKDRKMYIIQNSLLNDITYQYYPALCLVDYWNSHNINMGCEYIGERGREEYFKNKNHVIYRVDEDMTIYQSKHVNGNNKEGENGDCNYLQVLHYKNNVKAAMMQIL